MRKLNILFFLFISYHHLFAQCTNDITGLLVEEHTEEPLQFGVIQLSTTKEVFVTDSSGTFFFKNICEKKVVLSYTHPGCKTEQITVEFPLNAPLVLRLHHHAIDLNEVMISQHKRESAPTQQVEVLKEQDLFETRGMSFSESLKNLTGVNVLKTGNTISKPMIHGMTGQRVVILNNGIRIEGQQWGSEHAPEIDAYLAQKITLIKGASSIRYGSDAIAGVILVEPEPLPMVNGIGAQLNYAINSVNAQHDVSGLIQGNHKKLSPFSWRIQGTFRRGGDVATPRYLQRNTAFREANASLALGYKTPKRGIEIFASYFNTKIGILSSSHTGSLSDLRTAINADAPKEMRSFSYMIDRPYQQVQHLLSKLNAYSVLKKGTLYLDVYYQLNDREEFDKHFARKDSIANLNLPALKLWLQSIGGELNWEHKFKRWQGNVGVQFQTQTNTYRHAFLIPAYWNFSTGIFAIERWSNEKTEVELGARFDYRWLQALVLKRGEKREPIFNFLMPTFSVGIDHHLTHEMSINYHAGMAWRPPSINELFIDGLHHSTATIEIGRESMKSEKSLSLSAGWRWSKSMFDIDVSLFSHLFKDYIFLTPDTVPMLTIRGFFPVMRYVQTDVALSGSDISLAFRPHQDFEIGAKATLLWGVNLKKQDWLEQLPPHRFQYRVRYQRALSSNINQFYVGLAVNHVLQQTQIPKDNIDYMPPPEGYWLLNFDWGLTADIGKQKIGFGFTIANMLNTVYRDYTNRFRYFTDEAGINISARLKIPLYFH